MAWQKYLMSLGSITRPRLIPGMCIALPSRHENSLGQGSSQPPQAFYKAATELAPGEHVFTLNSVQYKFTTNITVPEEWCYLVAPGVKVTMFPPRSLPMALTGSLQLNQTLVSVLGLALTLSPNQPPSACQVWVLKLEGIRVTPMAQQ